MLLRATSLLLSATVARYIGQLGTFLLIVRYRGPEAAGTYALALAVATPVYVVTGLGLRTLYLTHQQQVAFGVYELLRVGTVVASIALALMAWLFLPTAALSLLLIVAIIKAAEAMIDLYGAVLQRVDMHTHLLLVTSAASALQVSCLAIVLVRGASVGAGLSLVAGAAIAVALALRRFALRAERLRDDSSIVSKQAMRLILHAGVPLGLSLGLIAITSTLPQYLLGWTDGPTEVGKYAALLYLVVVTEILLNALSQAWIPVGRALAVDGSLTRRTVLQVAWQWTLLSAPLSAAALTGGVLLFPYVLGQSFAIAWDEALPLVAAASLVPLGFAASTSLAIHNRYRAGLLISVSALAIGGAVGAALTHGLGVAGALWTYVLCHALRAVGALTLLR